MKSFESLVGASTRAAMHQNRQIKRFISRIVPVAVMENIQFCRLDAGRLRITVNTAAWVARLRFNDSQIIDVLRNQDLDVQSISYHVAAQEIGKSPPERRRSVQSTIRSIKTLEAAANSISSEADTNDDRLRQQLLRLAEKMRRSQS